MYFLPPRLMQLVIKSIVPFANWTDGAMGLGDPWIGFAYQWTVTFTVISQGHSSHLSALPFSYTVNDVAVGDWIADVSSGMAVKIVAINGFDSGGALSVVCEDVDRFNTFTDPTGTGTGIGSVGPGFVFTLNEDGLPILAPMSSIFTNLSFNLAWQQDQISRFQYRNYIRSFYRVFQPLNGFSTGDLLVLGVTANGTAVYSKVSTNTASVPAIVGQVNSIGAPGPGWFTLRPNGRLLTNLAPALPGLPGDLIYMAAGGLSNVAPSAWASPLYIQLEANTTAIGLNRGIDTAGSLGYVTQSFVVANQTIANTTLSKMNAGDLIMIDDAGLGEWTQYLMHQNTLRAISTQDSVRVDAETIGVSITPSTPLANVAVTGGGVQRAALMGNVSANRSVMTVNVQITAPFSPNCAISIGTTAAADLIMPSALIDLTMAGSYAYSPTVSFGPGYTSVYAFVNYSNTATGNATITLSYA